MEVQPLPVSLYKRAKEEGVKGITLSFSGGSDEGFLDVSAGEGCSGLCKDIEEWAWEVYEYSGAGDGSDYGDSIAYDLENNTVTTQEWFNEPMYQEPVETPLVQQEEEEQEEQDEPDDASARAKLIEDALESKTNEENPEWRASV